MTKQMICILCFMGWGTLAMATDLPVQIYEFPGQTVSYDVPVAMEEMPVGASPNTVKTYRAPAPPVQVRYGMTRQEIRSMPILERPNRPGHFYGNTVRRRAGVAY